MEDSTYKEVNVEEAIENLKKIGYISLTVGIAFTSGWLFWHWFFVPIGLPPINFWHSTAIVLSFRFIRGGRREDHEEITVEQTRRSALFWAVLMLLGFALSFGV